MKSRVNLSHKGYSFAANLVLVGFTSILALFGLDSLREKLPLVVVEIGIALGALLYAGVGVVSMMMGGEFLHYGMLDTHDMAHGQHLGILLVELGVGITVTFVMVAIFYAFAGRSRQ